MRKLMGLMALLAAPSLVVADSWSVTDPADRNEWYTATKLNDGRVLFAGGRLSGGGYLATATLFNNDNPAGQKWTATGSLVEADCAYPGAQGRARHAAALLGDGRVLVAGGTNGYCNAFASAEIFDPATGSWTVTGYMHEARQSPSLTKLMDGRVLVAGGAGYSPSGPQTAEIFDPATGTWTYTGQMNSARVGHTAILLNDGRVLVFGGTFGADWSPGEVYDPSTGTWMYTGPMNDRRGYEGGGTSPATLLDDGTVLVAGGRTDVFVGAPRSAERYIPQPGGPGTWVPAGNMAHGRDGLSATKLKNGMVLVEGGIEVFGGGPTETAELYVPDPSGGPGTWTPTASMSVGRFSHTSTRLNNGWVLAAGGHGVGDLLTVVELYKP